MGKLDSAIIAALKLDPALTSVSSHGGSGFSSTNKITISDSAKKPKVYFMKTGKGTDAETMFKGFDPTRPSPGLIIRKLALKHTQRRIRIPQCNPRCCTFSLP